MTFTELNWILVTISCKINEFFNVKQELEDLLMLYKQR